MIRRNRVGVLTELKRIDPEWEKLGYDLMLRQRVSLGDVLNVLEAVGIVLSPREKPEWDGRCHGVTVYGERCRLEVEPGKLHCNTPGHDK